MKILLVFLVGVLLFSSTAFAVIEGTLLPESSYYQGQSSFPAGGLSGHVDFAVYDDASEFESFGFEAPGDGDFIYAYQLFSDDADAAIEYFSILGMGENAFSDPAGDIGAISDSDDASIAGVEPTYIAFEDNSTRAVWEFSNSLLTSGEHSWFLVFSSDHDYKKGFYELSRPDGEIPMPAPEPCTVVLLGLGCMLIRFKKRGSY